MLRVFVREVPDHGSCRHGYRCPAFDVVREAQFRCQCHPEVGKTADQLKSAPIEEDVLVGTRVGSSVAEAHDLGFRDVDLDIRVGAPERCSPRVATESCLVLGEDDKIVCVKCEGCSCRSDLVGEAEGVYHVEKLACGIALRQAYSLLDRLLDQTVSIFDPDEVWFQQVSDEVEERTPDVVSSTQFHQESLPRDGIEALPEVNKSHVCHLRLAFFYEASG